MTKLTVWLIVLLVVIGSLVLLRDTSEEVVIENPPQPLGADSPRNASYEVEEQIIALSAGKAETSVPDSATSITTEIFGEPVIGDIDADGDADAVVWLVQQPGGTGTFYYVAAAVNENGGFTGTNAVYLGDRIAPQTLEIRNGQVIANFADRKLNEPMSAKPSVGVSKYLDLQNGVLVEVKAADTVE